MVVVGYSERSSQEKFGLLWVGVGGKAIQWTESITLARFESLRQEEILLAVSGSLGGTRRHVKWFSP